MATNVLSPPEHRTTPNTRPPDRRSALAIKSDTLIPALLTNLAQKVAATASATYRPLFGIGVTEWRIIALLAGRPWIAPVTICEATGLDKAAVSRSLRQLVDSGLVEVRSGEPNRRRLPVALTEEGLEVHDQMVGVEMDRQEWLLAGFTAEERALLRDFVARMSRQANAMKVRD